MKWFDGLDMFYFRVAFILVIGLLGLLAISNFAGASSVAPSGYVPEYYESFDSEASVLADGNTISGSPSFVDGHYIPVLSSGYVSTPFDFSNRTEFTVHMKVSLNASTNLGLGQFDGALDRVTFSFFSDGYVYMIVNDGGNTFKRASYSSSGPIDVYFVYDGSASSGNRGRVYIDGSLLPWDTSNVFPTSVSDIANKDQRIGIGNSGTGWNVDFSGNYFDMVEYYDFAMSTEQVQSFYPNDPSSVKVSGSAPYFDGSFVSSSSVTAEGATIYNSPVINNGVTFVDSSSQKVSYPSNVFSFDGLDSFSVAFSADFVSSKYFSIEQYESNFGRVGFSYFPDGKFYIVLNNGSASYGTVLMNAGFHEIVVLYDGSGVSNSDRIKLYVDGVLQSLSFVGTIPSSTSSFTSEPINFGYYSPTSSYSSGTLYSFKFFDRVLSVDEISHTYKPFLSCGDVFDGGYSGFGLLTGSTGVGSLSVDSGLDYFGVGDNYLTSSGDAVFYKNNSQAYGMWEYDFYKDSSATNLLYYFVSDSINESDANGYVVYININEAFTVREVLNGGMTNMLNSPNGYVDVDTWYRLRFTRSPSNRFEFYIKGGSFGVDDWHHIGGFSDSTYTTSNYTLIRNMAGGTLANFVYNDDYTYEFGECW